MTKPAPKKPAAKKAAKLPRWATGKCPAATRTAVILRDGRCVYCKARGDLSVDHLTVQSAFIDHRPTNLVTACMSCNRDRGVIDVDLFCQFIARRTGENWKKIYARVLAAAATPVKV